MRLIIACKEGVATATPLGEGWRLRERSLREVEFTSVAVSGDRIFLGSRNGLYISSDNGHDWQECSQGLDPDYIRWVYALNSVNLFAGTEPATIQRLDLSNPEDYAWIKADEVGAMRDKFGWSLPYSPRAGCVRGFDFAGERGYAAVEVGGLLRTDDGGGSWALVDGSTGRTDAPDHPEPDIWPDVHSVLIDPVEKSHVYCPTGKGLFKSEDDGATWQCLYRCYCRAVWVNPERRGHVILGPADGVSSNGRVEQSFDDGRQWEPVAPGNSQVWEEAMIERFVPSSTHLFAVRSDGVLMGAEMDNLAEWNCILPEITDARALAVIEDIA